MSKLPFGKKNYQLMVAGLLIITLGFILMMLDTEPHGFGFLGITLSPVVVLAGFIVEVVAILHTPKEDK
jgi:membrane-bound ClpP family serine protease